MQFFYELFPVLLFFITFKIYGIYTATVVGIMTSLLQVIGYRLWLKKWDKKQLITLVVFLFFGGLTLYFHNPIFVKWKPTIVFWIFAAVLLASQIVAKKPLMQSMLEQGLQSNEPVPVGVWRKINFSWALFLIMLGIANLYIAYYFGDNAWVNFKFYGITGLFIGASILQTLYLIRYISK